LWVGSNGGIPSRQVGRCELDWCCEFGWCCAFGQTGCGQTGCGFGGWCRSQLVSGKGCEAWRRHFGRHRFGPQLARWGWGIDRGSEREGGAVLGLDRRECESGGFVGGGRMLVPRAVCHDRLWGKREGLFMTDLPDGRITRGAFFHRHRPWWGDTNVGAAAIGAGGPSVGGGSTSNN
jgi:hypothetical protein